jgi:cytochrome c556
LRTPCRIIRTLACVALTAILAVACATVAPCQEQTAAAAKDEIFVRKILMDTVDRHMDEIDWMLGSGKPIDLARASDHADTISVMLMALPHLFPPSTNQWHRGVKRDPGRDTFASPDLWANFAEFSRQAAAASKLAYRASRATREAEFRSTVAGLRTACDSCHAVYVEKDQ